MDVAAKLNQVLYFGLIAGCKIVFTDEGCVYAGLPISFNFYKQVNSSKPNRALAKYGTIADCLRAGALEK